MNMPSDCRTYEDFVECYWYLYYGGFRTKIIILINPPKNTKQ